MRLTPASNERPLFWMGSAKKDLLAMPGPVVRELGMALGVAQYGGTHPAAKAWRGQGAGVLEIVANFDKGAFRAIYTVKFRRALYVLHCFQKKSPTGIKTSRTDVELVSKRLQQARADYEARYGKACT
jgi:phage-related protein